MPHSTATYFSCCRPNGRKDESVPCFYYKITIPGTADYPGSCLSSVKHQWDIKAAAAFQGRDQRISSKRDNQESTVGQTAKWFLFPSELHPKRDGRFYPVLDLKTTEVLTLAVFRSFLSNRSSRFSGLWGKVNKHNPKTSTVQFDYQMSGLYQSMPLYDYYACLWHHVHLQIHVTHFHHSAGAVPGPNIELVLHVLTEHRHDVLKPKSWHRHGTLMVPSQNHTCHNS